MRDFDPKELVRLNLNDPILQGYNRAIELNDPTLQGYNLVIKTRRDRVSELTDIAFRIRDTVFECLAPGRKTKMRNRSGSVLIHETSIDNQSFER
jgi:hypothetical protein